MENAVDALACFTADDHPVVQTRYGIFAARSMIMMVLSAKTPSMRSGVAHMWNEAAFTFQ